MRICVLGAGAVGGYLGACLAAADHDVMLVCRPTVAAAIGADGLTVSGPDSDEPILRARPGVATTLSEAWVTGPYDLVILAVKSYDLPAALDDLAALGSPTVPLLTIQNGIGLEELALERFKASELIAGSVTVPLSHPMAGRVVVERSGRGMTLAPTRPMQTVAHWATLGQEAGIATTTAADHRSLKWSKALLNMVGNATAAILNMHPGDVYRDRAGFGLEMAMLRETLAVMKQMDIAVINLPGSPALQLARAVRWSPRWALRPVLEGLVRRGRGAKLPSFLMDLNAGKRRSEVRYHNGAVAAAGAVCRVATPVNRTLNDILEALMDGRLNRTTYVGQPDALATAVARSGAGRPMPREKTR